MNIHRLFNIISNRVEKQYNTLYDKIYHYYQEFLDFLEKCTIENILRALAKIYEGIIFMGFKIVEIWINFYDLHPEMVLCFTLLFIIFGKLLTIVILAFFFLIYLILKLIFMHAYVWFLKSHIFSRKIDKLYIILKVFTFFKYNIIYQFFFISKNLIKLVSNFFLSFLYSFNFIKKIQSKNYDMYGNKIILIHKINLILFNFIYLIFTFNLNYYHYLFKKMSRWTSMLPYNYLDPASSGGIHGRTFETDYLPPDKVTLKPLVWFWLKLRLFVKARIKIIFFIKNNFYSKFTKIRLLRKLYYINKFMLFYIITNIKYFCILLIPISFLFIILVNIIKFFINL